MSGAPGAAAAQVHEEAAAHGPETEQQLPAAAVQHAGPGPAADKDASLVRTQIPGRQQTPALEVSALHGADRLEILPAGVPELHDAFVDGDRRARVRAGHLKVGALDRGHGRGGLDLEARTELQFLHDGVEQAAGQAEQGDRALGAGTQLGQGEITVRAQGYRRSVRQGQLQGGVLARL